MIHDTIRDYRYAVRALKAAPAFTLVALVTLALGIGANTAIFSVVHGLLLRPLPYEKPSELLYVDGSLFQNGREVHFQLSYPDIESIRTSATTIESIAAWNDAWGLALEGTDGARRLLGNFVGRDYFSILGAPPLLGRTFAAAEHALSAAPFVVVLSEQTWRQEFGADLQIIGKDLRLQSRVFTVIGVMPASFTDVAASHGSRIDVWVPIERAPEMFAGPTFNDHGSRIMWAIARVKPGVSVDAANAEMQAIGAQVAQAFPATNSEFTFKASPLANHYFVDARQPLWYLLGGSLFVLLIGCANVANLMLVRSSDRAREFAVRNALGASTLRLGRQVLAESLVLAGAGSVAGVLLASWMTPALLAFSGITLPPYASVQIDGIVLSVTVLTAVACGLLFSLAPVWRVARTSGRDAIATVRVARPSRAARWLAAFEMTAAFVLAAGALLILQSFAALTHTDLMFRADRLLTVRFELPQDRYPTPAARALAGSRLLEQMRQLPGIEHATIWGPSMFARSSWVAFLTPTDRTVADNERLMVWRHSTNPGALRDLGIALRSGRDIAASDTLGTPPVAIVSEAAARALWPGVDPIGRQMRVGTAPAPVTIIGVAADARHRGRFRFSLGQDAFRSQLDVYFPYAQRPNALVTLGVRTRGDAADATSSLRAALAQFDPGIAAYDIATLDDRLRDEEQPVEFAALLLNAYGVLAIALAAIGVYGVLAAAVASRTREIGIRTAIGADPRRLIAGVIGEGLSLSAVAVAMGAALAWVLARSFSGLLFGVSDATAVTLAGSAVLLVIVAAGASLVPARRAARVDPIQALRND